MMCDGAVTLAGICPPADLGMLRPAGTVLGRTAAIKGKHSSPANQILVFFANVGFASQCFTINECTI
jgi:hypothetical protein